ncbi:toll/interleukin-1 receptor domain-containing protein [Pseudomonas guariconensis]|uniref:toll/interleukin-1 receptor domain-containing protein n=1 Tax=Pseudomonas guariconensis TaxID=1288410 RepID=UPI0018A90E46|nr:toll/interleukin-1 receptor domain-containing protein [Pseudomonas guariconensis]MBF8742078.1 hypothetical protein [Pseudomonas guariconensis]MBF8751073.1 hypothetical protein [Pseudomonas guariconensis]
MHYGFNLSLDRKDLPVSNAVVEAHTNSVVAKRVDLRKYLLKDGNSISAELIAEHLFPKVKADVFISHSSADQEVAIQLAHELKKKGVEAFVDSVVWGSAYELLKVIDNNYSKVGSNEHYDYERRNRSTAHVYMILATALQKMIMQSSTLLFLNTSSSISTKHSVQGESMTHSPWIHMELMFSQMMYELEGGAMMDAAMESASAAPVFHKAPTWHLRSVSSSKFVSWLRERPERQNSIEFNRAIQSFHANPNRVY